MENKNTPCPVAQIIALFGGISSMGRALDHDFHTTVEGWKRAGTIPRWRHADVLNAARGIRKYKAVLDLIGEIKAASAKKKAAKKARREKRKKSPDRLSPQKALATTPAKLMKG